MQKSNETVDSSDTFAHLTTNAPTRLTASSFLATICLSTFALFFPTTFHINSFLDWETNIAAIAEILLAAASVFFLVMATGMSIIQIRLGKLDSRASRLLKEGTLADLSPKDQETLEKADTLYKDVARVYHWGLLALLVSLPFMGFHIHIIVGLTIVGAFIFVGIKLRKSLRFALFDRENPE